MSKIKNLVNPEPATNLVTKSTSVNRFKRRLGFVHWLFKFSLLAVPNHSLADHGRQGIYDRGASRMNRTFRLLNFSLALAVLMVGNAAVYAQSSSYCDGYAQDYARRYAQGGVVGGAVVGGAGGAIFGGIVGGSKGARRGAAIGAGMGAIGGGARQSDERAYLYNRAYQDCMRGRGSY